MLSNCLKYLLFLIYDIKHKMLQSLMHAADFINEIYMTRSVYDYLRSISLSLLTLDMIGMFNCLDKHSFF